MNPKTTSLRWRTTAMTAVGGFLAGAILLIAAPGGTAGAAQYDPYAPSDPCADITDVMASGGYGCTPPTTQPPTTLPPTTLPPTTLPPTTLPPTTLPPTTLPPTTEPPVTQPPTTTPRPGTGDVTATAVCLNDTTTLTVTLANISGDLPVAFTVTHPVTAVVSAVSVPAGSSSQFGLTGVPSGSVPVAITADGVSIGRTFQVPSCIASQPAAPANPIIAVTDSAPAAPPAPALPVTGNRHIELVLAVGALAALLAGGWLVHVANRRRLSGL